MDLSFQLFPHSSICTCVDQGEGDDDEHGHQENANQSEEVEAAKSDSRLGMKCSVGKGFYT